MSYLAIFIAVLLLAATVFIYFQIKENPSPERIKNKQRISTWWIIFAVCLGLLIISKWTSPMLILLLVGSLLFWTNTELYRLFEITIKLESYLLLTLCFIVFCILIWFYPQLGWVFFILALLSVIILSFVPIQSYFYLPLFSAYSFFTLFSIQAIAQMADNSSIDYSYLLLILFFITAVNDIAQYISGKLFGKTPIAPTISPNKTVVGMWGGILISSILSMILLPTVLAISVLKAFVFGSVLSFAGLWGDLIISKLKRALKIKDSGQSITGHGGILDRVDSLLLTAPSFGFLLWLGNYL